MPRRRTLEQMDRDAEALDKYLAGKPYRQISKEMEWRSPAAAYEAVKRALRDRHQSKFDQADHFAAAIERIHAGLQRCQEIIDTEHVAVTAAGKVATVFVDGVEKPVLDDGPKQRAITEMRHLNEQLIMLLDLRPPTKQKVTVVTEDVVDQEIAKLSKELAEAQKSAQSGRPANHPG